MDNLKSIQLGKNGKKWLKSFHILFAGMWVTGGLIATLLIIFINANSGGELYGINKVIHFIDLVIIVIGNTGLIITGIIYAIFTPWGWFKFKWINVKWIVTLVGLLFGIFFLGPWVTTIVNISKAEGLQALSNPDYQFAIKMIMWLGTIQVASTIFALFISTFKPWRKKKSDAL
jgi:hypothetical protein